MPRATITIHLPSHRSRALQIEQNTSEAVAAYDANIADYLKFLKQEALKQDFVVATDHSELASIFAINESDHAAKKAAHDWLQTQPDIWNWIP